MNITEVLTIAKPLVVEATRRGIQDTWEKTWGPVLASAEAALNTERSRMYYPDPSNIKLRQQRIAECELAVKKLPKWADFQKSMTVAMASEGANAKPEMVRQFLWSLAFEETRFASLSDMWKCYGAYDVTEHAMSSESLPELARQGSMPLPGMGKYLPGGTVDSPVNIIAKNGGSFLPDGVKYEYTIKSRGIFGVIDMRWFMQGYLTPTKVNMKAKEKFGIRYNSGNGYYDRKSIGKMCNATINQKSLYLADKWSAAGLDLEDFALAFLTDAGIESSEPKDGKHKERVFPPSSYPELAQKLEEKLRGHPSFSRCEVFLSPKNKGLYRLDVYIPDWDRDRGFLNVAKNTAEVVVQPAVIEVTLYKRKRKIIWGAKEGVNFRSNR